MSSSAALESCARRPGVPPSAPANAPGQVLQLDWAELPTRPRIAGRERRIYALVGSLPYSGAQSAHFSFDITLESFLEGHSRLFDWLGGVVRECVYDNLRSVVAKRERDEVRWNPRFLHLRGHFSFQATACTTQTPTREGLGRGSGAPPEDGLLAGQTARTRWATSTTNTRTARSGLQPPPARHRPLPRLRAPRRGAGGAQTAATRSL